MYEKEVLFHYSLPSKEWRWCCLKILWVDLVFVKDLFIRYQNLFEISNSGTLSSVIIKILFNVKLFFVRDLFIWYQNLFEISNSDTLFSVNIKISITFKLLFTNTITHQTDLFIWSLGIVDVIYSWRPMTGNQSLDTSAIHTLTVYTGRIRKFRMNTRL